MSGGVLESSLSSAGEASAGPGLKQARQAFESFGTPRLSRELVPKTSFFENLRNRVTPPQWNAVRRKVASAAGHVCQICGGTGTRWAVECHERWRYDDANRIQILEGLIALCPACHAVKHIGRQEVTGRAILRSNYCER
ncbi:MAG: HNH endonuclease [Acidobacteria bacterium]|nr:HNH endonuclease [Acidobacteriota bacterium]